MSNIHSKIRLLFVAGLAAAAAVLTADLGALADRGLHARYAGMFADESRTQAVLLVAVDEPTLAAWGPPPWTDERHEALASALGAGAPRLILWPEEYAGPRTTTTAPIGIDPLIGPPVIRATDPGFPGEALQALGFPGRDGPLPAHYVSFLPTISASRVAAGDIPPATFHDRVVIVGRTDPAVASVATPLGPMSPAQVEAHALLGLLDGSTWTTLPVWLRHAAIAAWALGLARALRGRSGAAIVAIAAAACAVAALVDLGLFATGVARVGVGTAVTIAVAAAVAQRMLPSASALATVWPRRRLRERADDLLAAASTASGVRRWSDA